MFPIVTNSTRVPKTLYFGEAEEKSGGKKSRQWRSGTEKEKKTPVGWWVSVKQLERQEESAGSASGARGGRAGRGGSGGSRHLFHGDSDTGCHFNWHGATDGESGGGRGGAALPPGPP